jgi:hypothetical protein
MFETTWANYEITPEACETAVITYNNYYVETFTQKIVNYCNALKVLHKLDTY